MIKLPNLLARSALVAAIGVTGVMAGAGAANAQSWQWRERTTVQRCERDRCATFRCDEDGDCARVSGWSYRNNNRGYYTRRDYGRASTTRCTADGRCATFRCNWDGDSCTRVSGWWYR